VAFYEMYEKISTQAAAMQIFDGIDPDAKGN